MNQQPRVLVTGASRGIGKAIAIRLANEGYQVVMNYRGNHEAAQQALAIVNQQAEQGYLLPFDISQREQAKASIEKDIAENGAYFGVVLNAGIAKDNAFPAMTEQDWDGVIHTNLDGLYNVLHPLIMPMIQTRKGGRIITLSSLSGEVGNRGQVNYSAAKAGIIGATKALALEVAKRKITVNCVAPGLIDTEMMAGLPLDQIKQQIPLRRLGDVEEVAGTVAFLMSKDAAYITRQVISVNGGIA
ncbi:3-oxoacyl-ACP reductase FabG [Agarivorans sp. TSD2052]|uniref:3-oxoacyl-ACP reductase FabG n=1 Tax=Agarivorans sp. TSD2052 TaxID=2937286 RepID=UPI00200BF7D6|nr:3-oxoacyl-ACP reductase FabG [Agarivorans sp. TSD2052]UPW19352.1 3-oxoacyl-ACP reductase FabG [Agarivorans sp. TSD2052]